MQRRIVVRHVHSLFFFELIPSGESSICVHPVCMASTTTLALYTSQYPDSFSPQEAEEAEEAAEAAAPRIAVQVLPRGMSNSMASVARFVAHVACRRVSANAERSRRLKSLLCVRSRVCGRHLPVSHSLASESRTVIRLA